MPEGIANVDDPETEVTPEMIEAGEMEYYGKSRKYYGADDIVTGIFRAMVAASKKAVVQDR